MRSPLETYTDKRLREEQIVFEYEPYSIQLLPAFSHSFRCIEKPSKIFKEMSPKIRSINYTPDFVGDGWIMEVKGRRTPEFDLRWKLFKYILKDFEDLIVFMPRRQKDVEEAIDVIKNGQNKRIFQFGEGIKLTPKKSTKPKAAKVKERKPRARGL